MSLLATKAKIHSYEARICSLQEENRLLRDKIQRLEQADSDYQKKYEALETNQLRELARADELRGKAVVKAAGSYADVLASSVSGSKNYLARESFMGISKTINDHKQQLEDEIKDNERSISRLSQEISYLNSRLASMS